MAKCILIVDDEPRYLRLLEVNLKTEGYTVVTAASRWVCNLSAYSGVLQRTDHYAYRQRRRTRPS